SRNGMGRARLHGRLRTWGNKSDRMQPDGGRGGGMKFGIGQPMRRHEDRAALPRSTRPYQAHRRSHGAAHVRRAACRYRRGRPRIGKEVRDLIRRMSFENPLWGAPKMHGELLNAAARSAIADLEDRYSQPHGRD